MNKNIDLKIIYEFINKYEKLKKEGEISDENFQEILALLDNFDQISKKELESKLEGIS
ncbi:MAG: hypothetical protein KGY44_08105 [Halanaerobiales bacterium]|nr:hypothetical protein [Halanaerobiales bacterium]